MRKIGIICSALLLILSLSGCGYPELYERVLVHGVGVDWTGDGYRVTVRSSASVEDEGEELFVCEGDSVLQALSDLSLTTGREPFYSHNYLVVFGMDCALNGLDDCLDFFVRYYNTRPAVKMFLSATTAEEVMSTEKDGKLMKMSQLQALGKGGQYNGQAAEVEILDFVNGVKGEGTSPVLPVLRATEEGVEVFATGYFNGCRLAGLMDLKQTRGWLAAMDRLKMGELTVDGPDSGTVTLSLRKVSGNIEGDVSGGISFQINLEVDADISSADRVKLDGPDAYSQIEDAARQLLEDEVHNAIDQAVIDSSCDIFGFGRLLYREEPEYWRQNKDSWPDLMAECQYQVSASVKVRRLEQENRNGIG